MKKTFVIHSCWAIAVLAAFGIGSWKSGPDEGAFPGTSDASKTAERSRLDGSNPDSSENRSSTRSSDRRQAKRENSHLGRLFGSIASSDGNLDALLEQALRDPNPITRRLAFSRLLEAMTPENAAALREQMVAIGADPEQWRDFHYSWGAIAGKEAVDHATNSPERDLASTMSGWAAANPAEALAMLDNLPEELQGQRDELTASVVSGLAHSDRSMATDLVLRLGQQGNDQAGRLMEIVANETLRTQGPEAASRWSETLPNGPLKGTAMGRIADLYAARDPQAAARWVQGFAGESYAAQAVEQIGERLAQNDPAAAVGWLESLPPGNGQISGLRTVFSDWEDRDPVAAGEYLMAMPLSPQRDSAVSGYATGYAWQNPLVAIAWAKDIRDPALRESSLTRVGQAYFERDPAAAKNWLPASGLSAQSQQQVLNGRR